MNADLAAAHFGAGPIVGIAVNYDRAAGHRGAEVGADVAMNGQPASDILSQPFHAVAIAFDDNVGIGRIAGDGEEVAEDGEALPCCTVRAAI